MARTRSSPSARPRGEVEEVPGPETPEAGCGGAAAAAEAFACWHTPRQPASACSLGFCVDAMALSSDGRRLFCAGGPGGGLAVLCAETSWRTTVVCRSLPGKGHAGGVTALVVDDDPLGEGDFFTTGRDGEVRALFFISSAEACAESPVLLPWLTPPPSTSSAAGGPTACPSALAAPIRMERPTW